MQPGTPTSPQPNEEIAQRVCPRCEAMLPERRFPALPEIPHCEVCIQVIQKEQDREEALAILEAGQTEIFEAAKNTSAGTTVGEISTKLMSKLGGVDEFAAMWARDLKEAVVNHPGRASNQRSFFQIAELVKHSQQEERETEISQLTNEQLKMENAKALMDLLRKNYGEDAARLAMAKLLHQNAGATAEELGAIAEESEIQ